MGTYTLFFENNQLADFNTTSATATSREMTINNNHPGDRLVDAGNISAVSDIDQWRFTVQGDDALDGNGNDVVPDAPMIIEYTTDGGATWNDYVANIDFPAGVNPSTQFYSAREDEEGWMSVVTNFGSATSGGAYGFIVSDIPPTAGQVFVTDDYGLNPPKVGEYILPICFARDMAIKTDSGEVLVQNLRIGDRVWTLDNGYQPIRFIRAWTSPSIGKNRPIIFEPGTISNDRQVRVSHEHRILASCIADDIRGSIQGLNIDNVKGDTNLLIKASLLVNGGSVRFDTSLREVEYFHIMFDNHELIDCHGSISESWQPKLKNLRRDQALADELNRLFPDFDELPAHCRLPVRQELAQVNFEGQLILVRALKKRD